MQSVQNQSCDVTSVALFDVQKQGSFFEIQGSSVGSTGLF